MKTLVHLTIIAIVSFSNLLLAQSKINVKPFNKVIISPHIETTFVKGNEESVTIVDSTEPEDKINIEVKGKTLRVYLDDAKELTKNKKVKTKNYKTRKPIYNGKVLTILVTYKTLDILSLRGEERTLVKDKLTNDKFKLRIYGESEITFNEVDFEDFDVDVYGESQLTIKKGTTGHQSITAYGEGKINLVEVLNKTSKLKAYGEAEFRLNSSEKIRFTAYGEAELYYRGEAEVSQGLSFGDSKITRI